MKLRAAGLQRAVRILQLSDFHASSFVPFSTIERSVEMGLQEKPGLICLTGDFITNGEEVDAVRYERILHRLSSAAPVYAVLGNHDGGAWAPQIGGFSDSSFVRSILAASGIVLLHNKAAEIRVGRQPVILSGVGDLWSKEVDPPAAFYGLSQSETPVVLLAHNPDTKDLVADRPWHLMLCGHTHGGQIVLPGCTRFVPVRDKRFIAGLKDWRGKRIYISRGVGSIAGVRVNCRPEVTILDLQAAA